MRNTSHITRKFNIRQRKPQQPLLKQRNNSTTVA